MKLKQAFCKNGTRFLCFFLSRLACSLKKEVGRLSHPSDLHFSGMIEIGFHHL